MLNAKQGKSKTFSALADSGAEMNIINRATVKRMGLPLLNIYGMHYIEFQQEDEQGHVRYFQDTFLAADISTRVIRDMP